MTRSISFYLVVALLLVSTPSVATMQEDDLKAASSFIEKIKATSKKEGKQSLAVAKLLVELGAVYFRLGRFPDAELVYQESLDIRQKLLPAEHREIVESLGALGAANLGLGRYLRAEEYFNQSLKMAEKILDPLDEHIADILSNLCVINQTNGRLAEGERNCNRSIEINQKIRGPNDYHIGVALNALAMVYQTQGRYVDAEAMFKRNLEFRVKNQGSEHPAVATVLSNIGGLLQSQGRTQEAESLYSRALLIQERALGSGHPDTISSRIFLGQLNLSSGRDVQAEQLFRKSLSLCESKSWESSPICASVYISIGGLYMSKGRYADAEALFTRGLAISEQSFGETSSFVLTLKSLLATIYQLQNRQEEAKALKRRVRNAQMEAITADDPRFADSLSDLAAEKSEDGECSEAIPLLEKALAINEKTLGRENVKAIGNWSSLAICYFETERYEDAEQARKRQLAILEATSLSETERAVPVHMGLVNLYLRVQKPIQAMAHSRKAATIVRQIALSAQANNGGQGSPDSPFSIVLIMHFHLLSVVANALGGLSGELLNESFDLAQVARLSSTAEAVAQTAARFASGSDGMARIVRQRQDVAGRQRALDAALIRAFGVPLDKRNIEQERSLRAEYEKTNASIQILDKQIDRDFPMYRELTRPQPLAVAEAQKLLRPDEALLTYVVDKSESYLWLVRRDAARFIPIARTAESIKDSVQLLRQSLDLSNVKQVDQIRRFDLKESTELYQALWQPISADLAGVRHVFIVADGPLQSLPFSVLLESLPKEEVQQFSDYRNLPWLGKRYGLSTLPAVSSLRALRLSATRRGEAKQPFIGFGDPLLTGKPDTKRGISMAEFYSRGSVANVDNLRKLPRLADTADELIAQSRLFKAGNASLYLRERDTEDAIKRIDLSQYRVISFATHGLLAGQFKGVAEPALVFTPPTQGTELDDGLLTASEVAQLKLNADWIVMSACNTAGPSGEPGAEGLSGLAKAFFYAGARSLLVTHWPVNSESTVALMKNVFSEYVKNPKRGKADAVRRGMVRLMNNDKRPYFAHPVFWAPFALVGEGGVNAGR